ncbi:hypothetical protein CHU98_g2411 [Xylaria longipes]|nr:hypothetical protein CHU98_g2411 [Xylaria longipes]
MAPTTENYLKQMDSVTDEKFHEETREINTASAALETAVAQQKPKLLSPSMLRLYVIMGIGYLVSTMNGFDSSLMGAINAMKPYQETFGLDGAGSTTGIIFIIYQIGQIASFPFCGLFADGLGRRWCIFIGCFIVLVGTAIQGSASHLGQFIGGRFVLGFGASIASAAGPAYTVELAHPAYRGTMAGMYNNFWWVGNILAGWTTYGTNLNIRNSWAWRTPTIVQAGIPAVVLACIYHGEGDPSSPLVQLQYHEIIEEYQASKNDNHWWDFRELANTRAARYRLAMVIGMSFFGQWMSYFLPEMIAAAGITSTNTQLLINAINPIFSLIAAIYGATCLDRLGRRPMMLWGLAGSCIFYILLTAFTAETAHHPNLSYGTIVSIYLFGICFAWGFTPLQTLYAVECLGNRTRAKGSGLNFLFVNVAIIVNTYGISVGIKVIEWRLYGALTPNSKLQCPILTNIFVIVYIGWIVVEMILIYFFFVETAGKTLEELTEIFEAPNPRKFSTRKFKLEVTSTGQVVGISDAHQA